MLWEGNLGSLSARGRRKVHDRNGTGASCSVRNTAPSSPLLRLRRAARGDAEAAVEKRARRRASAPVGVSQSVFRRGRLSFKGKRESKRFLPFSLGCVQHPSFCCCSYLAHHPCRRDVEEACLGVLYPSARSSILICLVRTAWTGLPSRPVYVQAVEPIHDTASGGPEAG